MKRPIVLLSLFLLTLASCVPARLHNEMKSAREACEKDNESLRASNLELTTRVNELSAAVDELKSRLGALEADTLRLNEELRRQNAAYDRINSAYQTMMKDGAGSAANQEATRQLIRDLQKTQEELQLREDELRKKEKALQQKQDSLRITNQRLTELERILNQKDLAVKALRNSVANALMGYTDNGLSVEMRNGKVYVMMEERLLFTTGSIVVDPKGVEAIRDLGKVLEKNPDISILIEGHTDNVPMKGSGEIKDNWDLSVMRATSVVKILLGNKQIDPLRITAAGRGEFMPVDKANTPEARKKNRRIEVILSPKLDEILKILDTH
jgi:chemotaxis protein MotB